MMTYIRFYVCPLNSFYLQNIKDGDTDSLKRYGNCYLCCQQEKWTDNEMSSERLILKQKYVCLKILLVVIWCDL